MTIPKKLAWPIAAVSGYGMFYFAANRAMFHPLKYPAGWWEAKARLGADDVWLRAADGTRLHGWWMAPPGARVASVFLHGNAGNITHRAETAHEVTAAGSAVLLLDYRGYGRSEGRPTERGLYADAEAAYRHVLGRGFAANHVILHGESLGTAVAVELASRVACGGLILEAPFTSARDMAATVLPWVGPLFVSGFDTRARIGAVRVPVLVIHGERDSIVPYRLGQAVFAAANEPKRFWTIRGGDHNNLMEAAGVRYREELRRFYAQL